MRNLVGKLKTKEKEPQVYIQYIICIDIGVYVFFLVNRNFIHAKKTYSANERVSKS